MIVIPRKYTDFERLQKKKYRSDKYSYRLSQYIRELVEDIKDKFEKK